MKKFYTLIVLLPVSSYLFLICVLCLFFQGCQKDKEQDEEQGLNLNFSAINNDLYVRLDSIKVINRDYGGNGIVIHYPDTSIVTWSDMPNYSIGDHLLYVGYYDNLQSGILDAPNSNKNYTFQFATNIPCPGMPTVNYEGKIYNTIQIFSQCWLKENMNVGTMIPKSNNMADNGIIEKYCYNDDPDNCAKYGGLYQWHEMMQYISKDKTQGICPPEWHIPTDEEWKVLEGASDSKFRIGDMNWDFGDWRGYDAGLNLKSTEGWIQGGNGTDAVGFSAYPSGFRFSNGEMDGIGKVLYYYTATIQSVNNPIRRVITSSSDNVHKGVLPTDWAFSVRCIKD